MDSAKRDLIWLHALITVFLMFGFGFLTPIGSITPIGMKLLGIFFGVIYAWTTTTLIWPSLLGIVAVGMSGIMPMGEFFKLSFANETVLFILFIFVFVAAMEKVGLVNFLANWFVSRKFIMGKPWLFTFVFLFGAFICGTLVNEIAATLMFWRIYYSIAEKFDFKPYSKYSTLMILGIAFAACTAGGSTFPFKLGPMIWLTAYSSISGVAVNYVKYVLFALPIASFTIVLYTLIMRFIFKPDISRLQELDENFADKEALILNKQQKIAFGFLGLMIVLLLAPDLLPKTWVLNQILIAMTKPGIMMVLIVFLFLVRVEGKSLMDFPLMARSISWDIYFLFALILPLSTILTTDATGIKPFLVSVLSPILMGKSILVFAFLVLFTGAVITNFANNAVLGIIYISMMCPLAESMGFEVFPIIAVMVFTIQLAYLTPAGSAPAAIVFGNSEWVRAQDLYKYVPIIMLCLFIGIFIIGMPLAYVIF